MVLSLLFAGGTLSAFLQKRIQQLRAEFMGGDGKELYIEQGAVSQGVYPCHVGRRGTEAAEALLPGKRLRLIVIPLYRAP
ncbi:hypothetical protein D3C75_658680 [compost metagenome]